MKIKRFSMVSKVQSNILGDSDLVNYQKIFGVSETKKILEPLSNDFRKEYKKNSAQIKRGYKTGLALNLAPAVLTAGYGLYKYSKDKSKPKEDSESKLETKRGTKEKISDSLRVGSGAVLGGMTGSLNSLKSSLNKVNLEKLRLEKELEYLESKGVSEKDLENIKKISKHYKKSTNKAINKIISHAKKRAIRDGLIGAGVGTLSGIGAVYLKNRKKDPKSLGISIDLPDNKKSNPDTDKDVK